MGAGRMWLGVALLAATAALVSAESWFRVRHNAQQLFNKLAASEGAACRACERAPLPALLPPPLQPRNLLGRTLQQPQRMRSWMPLSAKNAPWDRSLTRCMGSTGAWRFTPKRRPLPHRDTAASTLSLQRWAVQLECSTCVCWSNRSGEDCRSPHCSQGSAVVIHVVSW